VLHAIGLAGSCPKQWWQLEFLHAFSIIYTMTTTTTTMMMKLGGNKKK
jgi:hypothetical protein